MDSRNVPPMTSQEETSAMAASHDIFQDPALAQTVKDDPLFLLLKKWWVHIAVFAGAIILGIYAKGVFEETGRAELMRASDIFTELESRFEDIPALETALAKAQSEAAAATDKKDDAQKKVTEAQAALDQGNARLASLVTSLEESTQPYTELGKIYRGALAARAGNREAARTVLSLTRWGTLKPERTPERFMAELEALVLARAELDDLANAAAGRATLRSLTEQGLFMAIPAGVALASSAASSQEKAEAKAALENLKAKFPEQTELLDNALTREL